MPPKVAGTPRWPMNATFNLLVALAPSPAAVARRPEELSRCRRSPVGADVTLTLEVQHDLLSRLLGGELPRVDHDIGIRRLFVRV